MGYVTAANTKVKAKESSPNCTVVLRVPQVGIVVPLAVTRCGPVGLFLELNGRTLRSAPVSTKKLARERRSKRWRRLPPAVTGFSVHRRPIRFPAAEPKHRGGGKNGQRCRIVCGRSKTVGVFVGLLMVAAAAVRGQQQLGPHRV